MREIHLSTMVQKDVLDLASLEERADLFVHHQQFDWATGWNNVLQIGLYQKGPDVSEVGSTWLQNLNEIRAVRPFRPEEIEALGGADAFQESVMTQQAAGEDPAGETQRITSIPWLVDTRLVHYRRDLFEKAGAADAAEPGSGAFDTPEAMYETLARLQAGGIPYPLTMATGGLSLHNLACFIWGRGGSFRSPDYRRLTLLEPEARQGLRDYFRLHRFIHPEARSLDYYGADNRFFFNDAAVAFTGQWVMGMVKAGAAKAPLAPALVENTAYALPPGVPYVGGTHLVIWRHSIHADKAIELIAHLTSLPVLERVFQATGNFPARKEALEYGAFAADPDYQLVFECLRRGRAFRSARLWAGIEMRLSAMCDQLWKDLFANPELDLDKEIERRVSELSARLERTLLGSW